MPPSGPSRMVYLPPYRDRDQYLRLTDAVIPMTIAFRATGRRVKELERYRELEKRCTAERRHGQMSLPLRDPPHPHQSANTQLGPAAVRIPRLSRRLSTSRLMSWRAIYGA
jgi:hypothetical protein